MKSSAFSGECEISVAVLRVGDTVPVMAGEQAHKTGREGAIKAKRWLEASTRAQVPWVNPDGPAVAKLTFDWMDSSGSFSYDVGGFFEGGELAGHEFLGESKKYANAQDQLSLYKAFLAKCYCVRASGSTRGDVFLWITWAAFGTTVWSELRSPEYVSKAVLAHRKRAVGDDDSEVDAAVVDSLSKSVWILVLAEEQEKHLVLTPEHEGVIRRYIVEKAASV
jgi:hypothetical protein